MRSNLVVSMRVFKMNIRASLFRNTFSNEVFLSRSSGYHFPAKLLANLRTTDPMHPEKLA